MDVQERLSAVDELLSVDRWNDAQIADLRKHVDELVVEPDGREFIQRKIDEGRFRNRKVFFTAVFRALNHWRDAASGGDLQQLQRLAANIAKSTKIREDVFWSALVFLKDTQYFQTGGILREELRRQPSVRRDARLSLGDFDWKHLCVEDRIWFLEASKRGATDREFDNIVDKALQTLRLNARRPEPIDTSRTKSSDSSSASASDLAVPETHLSQPAKNQQAAVGDMSASAPAAQLAITSPKTAIGTLDDCLTVVAQTIRSFFQRESDKLAEADEELDRLTRAKNAAEERSQIDARRMAQLEDELERVRKELQNVQSTNETRKREIDDLQHRLSLTARELTDATALSQSLSWQLKTARTEAEQAEARANDYVHQANLEIQHAVNTFRGKIWSRLKPYFLEVLHADTSTEQLTREHVMLLQRLQQIVDVLREFEIARE